MLVKRLLLITDDMAPVGFRKAAWQGALFPDAISK